MKSSLHAIWKGIFLSLAGFIVVLAALLVSCNNPFVAGLGDRVDLARPVFNWIEPEPGLFVRGEEKLLFRAHVTDDIAVADVYIYFWRQDELEPADSDVTRRFLMTNSTQAADLPSNLRDPDVWIFYLDIENQLINGKPLTDGDLLIKGVAYDTSDKSDFAKLNCIIKTRPPLVTLSYPFLDADFWETVPEVFDPVFNIYSYDWTGFSKPFVFSRSAIYGSVFDAQGIRPRHPEIMFWRYGETEPNPLDDSNWKSMDQYQAVSSDWPTSAINAPNLQLVKNVGFMYELFERDALGQPNHASPLPQSDTPYLFRVRAWDSGRLENGDIVPNSPMMTYYPPIGNGTIKSPGWFPAAEVYITGNEGPPELELFYNGDLTAIPGVRDAYFTNVPIQPIPYIILKDNNPLSPFEQKEARETEYTIHPFAIEARIWFSGRIAQANLFVNDMQMKWEQDLSSQYNDRLISFAGDPRWMSRHGTDKFGYQLLTIPLQKGAVIKDINDDDFTFDSGEYEFSVRILEFGVTAAPENFIRKEIRVVINDTPPTVEITAVSPFTDDHPDLPPGSIPTYTVNGHINVSWIADAGVVGFDPVESRKFLVRPIVTGTIIETDYADLFHDPDAVPYVRSTVHFDTLNGTYNGDVIPPVPLSGPVPASWVLNTTTNIWEPVSIPPAPPPHIRRYYLYILAQDRSGLFNGAVCEIIVDQSKDWPEITLDTTIFDKPDAFAYSDLTNTITVNFRNPDITPLPSPFSVSVLRNTIGSGDRLRAALMDDDGIFSLAAVNPTDDPNNNDLLRMQLFSYDVDLDESTLLPAPPPFPDLSGRNRSRSIDLNYDISTLPDGIYSFNFILSDSWIRKNRDNRGNVFSADQQPHPARVTTLAGPRLGPPYTGAAHPAIFFNVSTKEPDIWATRTALPSGERYSEGIVYTSKTPFPLTIHSDDHELAALIVHQRESATNTSVVIRNDRWPAFDSGESFIMPDLPRNPLNPGTAWGVGAQDGNYYYTVLAVNKAGLMTERRYQFILDNGAPIIATVVAEPIVMSPNFSASGRVVDQGDLSQISHVYYTLQEDPDFLRPGGVTMNMSTYIDEFGALINPAANPWEMGLVGGNDWNAQVTYPGSGGRMYLYVAARDIAGNISSPAATDIETGNNWATPGPWNNAFIGKRSVFIDLSPPELVWDKRWPANAAQAWNTTDYLTITTGQLSLDAMFNDPDDDANPFSSSVNKPLGDINYFTNDDFTLTFTAIDTIALGSVTVQRNGVPVNLSAPAVNVTLWGRTGGVNTTTTVYPAGSLSDGLDSFITAARFVIPNDGLADGPHTFRITITDFAGRERVVPEFTVIVDKEPPDLVITTTSAAFIEDNQVAGQPLYTVNGVFRFGASISDLWGVDGGKWWLLPRTSPTTDPDTSPVWNDPITAGGIAAGRTIAAAGDGGTSLLEFVDTWGRPNYTTGWPQGLIENGHYTLYVIARDKAGNESIVKRFIEVDQETDKPVITINSPQNGSFVTIASNLSATITDDDNVHSIAIRYSIDEGANWDDVVGYELGSPHLISSPAREYPFFVNLNTLTGMNSDGVKMLEFTVGDHPESKLPDTAPSTGDRARPAVTTTQIVTFTRDTIDPEIEVTGVTRAGGSLIDTAPLPNVFNTDFTLSGTLTEMNLGHMDGNETNPPNFKWTIGTGGGGREGFITPVLSGSAPDYTWSLEIEINPMISPPLEEGLHTIRFDVIDKAGNSGFTQFNFIKDTSAPEIDLTNIEKVRIDPALFALGPTNPAFTAEMDKVHTIEETNALIRGFFSDEFSMIGNVLALNSVTGVEEYFFEYRIYDQEHLAGIKTPMPEYARHFLGPSTNRSVNWSIPLTGTSPGGFWTGDDGIRDGTYWLDIRVFDRIGNPLTPPAGGLVPLADGSLGGIGLLTNMVFAVDRQAPDITIFPTTNIEHPTQVSTHPAGHIFGVRTTDVFTLRGTASDANFDELRIRLNDSTTPDIISGPLVVTIGPPQLRTLNWEWVLTPAVYNTLPEGLNTVTFTALDTAGRESVRTWSFTKDTTPPELELLNLSFAGSTGFEGDAIRLQSLANDDFGLLSIETRLERRINIGANVGDWVFIDDRTDGYTGALNPDRFTMHRQAAPNGNLGFTVSWFKPITDDPTVGTGTDTDRGVDLPMGRYRLIVRLTDRADPPNISYNNRLFTDFTYSTLPAGTSGDEIYFSRGGSVPTLTVSPTVMYANGDNSPANRNFLGITYTPQPETVGLDPTDPDDFGFYITGIASNTEEGLDSVIAELFDGNTLEGTYPFDGSLLSPNEPWNWWILIPEEDLDNGKTYTVRITASSGRSTSQTRDFIWDVTPPTWDIITPGRYERVTGNTFVRGASGDNNSVRRVEYRIGKSSVWADTLLHTSSPAAGFSGGLYSWTHEFPNIGDDILWANTTMSDRINFIPTNPPATRPDTVIYDTSINEWRMPFEIRVTDIAGNQTVNHMTYSGDTNTTYYLFLDPDRDIPTAEFISPNADNLRMGGEILVTGFAEDNNWMYAVLIRTYKGNIDPDNVVHYPVNSNDTRITSRSTDPNYDGWALATFSNRGPVVNWNYPLNLFGELNSTTGPEQTVNIEILPIDSKAFETAVTVPSETEMRYFELNPMEYRIGDPAVRFLTIDSSVPSIERIRIERTNDIVDYGPGVRTAGIFTIHAEIIGTNGIRNARWRSAGLTPGNTWENMLTDGVAQSSTAFTVSMPVTAAGTTALVNYPGNTLEIGRKYMIENPGSGVSWTSIGLPTGTGAKGDIFVYNGNPLSGTFSVYAAQGPLLIPPLSGNPTTDRDNAYNQRFHYPVRITDIDSTDRFPVGPRTTPPVSPSSGNFLLDLFASDYTSPIAFSAQANLVIQVDNFYPSSIYNAPRNAATRAYWVQGRARDINLAQNSGNIEGIYEVLAYFRRGNNYYNPYGIQWPAGHATTVRNVRDMDPNSTFNALKDSDTDVVASFSEYPNMDVPIGNTDTFTGILRPNEIGGGIDLFGAARIRINEMSEDTNNNGYVERFSERGGQIEWGFEFNTWNFQDGPIELHYIVIDMAGNATRYKERLYIRNNPPLISKITLMTDYTFNNVAGTIPAEIGEFAYPPLGNRIPYKTTGFISRNYRLNFDIETLDGSGIGNKTFRVTPVTEGTITVNSTALVEGTVYEIVTAGNTDWALVGSNSNLVGTVFVATDFANPETSTGDVTTGTARAYNEIAPAKQQGGVSGTTATISFGNGTRWLTDPDDDFRQTSGFIPDSPSGGNSYFLIKVFDSTVPAGPGVTEADQQADVVLVGLTINNIDNTAPVALIDPFHWRSASDNSLFQNNRNNGHIEYEGNFPATFFNQANPKVSGQISIRGTLDDNNVAGSLWVNMQGISLPSYGTGTTDTIGADTWTRIAVYDTVTAQMTGVTDQWATNGWRSSVTLLSLDQDGHKLTWQLDIDTRRHTNVAALNQAFRVISRDMSTNNQAASPVNGTQTTRAARSSVYRMDIVPYITSIDTMVRTQGGLKRENIRSADGRFSVIQGTNNAFITVRGFNLNPAATSGSVRIMNETQNNNYRTPNPTTGNPGNAAVGTAFTPSGMGAPYTSFTMSNNSNVSGYLTVIVNNIGSLNNINNDNALGDYRLRLSTPDPSVGTVYQLIPSTADIEGSNGSDEENMPNRNADRYITRNITLNDDRYLQFYKVVKTNVANGYYPVMMMTQNRSGAGITNVEQEGHPVFGYVDLTGGTGTGTAGAATLGNSATGIDWAPTSNVASVRNAGSYNPSHAMPQRTIFNIDTGFRIDTEHLIKANIWDSMGMARDDSGRYIHASAYNRDNASFHLVYDRFAELHTQGAATDVTNWGTGWGQGTTYTGYPGVSASNANAIGTNAGRAENNNGIALETHNFAPGLMLDRYTYPKLIARGNSVTGFARYYMSYYDAHSRQIIFRHFRIGNSSTAGNGRLYTTNTTTNRTDFHGRSYDGYTNLNNNSATNTTIDTVRRIAVDNNATESASSHFAMVVDNGASANRAVIAYYDETAGRIRIKYSQALDGTVGTSPTWISSPAILPDYVGMHISMAHSTTSNSLHIAAFNALDSTLSYIYIHDYQATTEGGAGVVHVTVDFYGSVGNWTQIKLHPGRPAATGVPAIAAGTPYIAYYNATETGGRESIKIAWAKVAINTTALAIANPGVDINGFTTNRWEYRTVPAIDPPQGGSTKFQKVNLDFRPNGDPILGYLANNIEFSYPIGE
ncbi:MAG: hypothetical protein FWG89_03025 [Treponema sp.]|nr:hypothetical protein [Treponema sp.]